MEIVQTLNQLEENLINAEDIWNKKYAKLLASKSTEDLLNLFDQINAAGRTVVVITHEHDVGMRAKRIVRMRDGKIVSDELNRERAS